MAEYDKGRYYWIKLTDRFMTSDTVDFLMSQKDGANYVVLYQMLCLKTINNEGVMARQIGEVIVPYDIDKIQRDCKWFPIDTVRIALGLYKKLGLVYENNDGVLAITDFDRLIGSQSIGAEKKQIQRAVDKCPPQCPPLCPPEKDIRDKDNKNNNIYTAACASVFEHWNAKNIIKHRELTDDIAKAIEKALKVYPEEAIKTYIDRYAKVVGDETYFFAYKWTLKDFLTRKDGIASFTDEGSKWVSYTTRQTAPAKGRNVQPKESSFKAGDFFAKAVAKTYGDTR